MGVRQAIVAIVAPAAPPPAGHYSHAIRAGDFLFVSGQVPRDAAGVYEPSDVDTETRRALRPTGALVMDVIGSPLTSWSDLGLANDRRFAIHRGIATVITNADDRASARLAIQGLLGCDDISAQAIMNARLEQLTKDQRAVIAAEIEQLKGRL